MQAPPTQGTKRSKVEIFKEESDFLRHPLIEELANSNPNVNAAAEQVSIGMNAKKVRGWFTPARKGFRV